MKTLNIKILNLKKYQLHLSKFLTLLAFISLWTCLATAQSIEDYFSKYNSDLNFSENANRILKQIRKDYPADTSLNELSFYIFKNTQNSNATKFMQLSNNLKIASIGIQEVRLKYQGPLAVIDQAIWGSNEWLRFGATYVLLNDVKNIGSLRRALNLHSYLDVPTERKNKLLKLFLHQMALTETLANPQSPNLVKVAQDLTSILVLFYPHQDTRVREILEVYNQTSAFFERKILQHIVFQEVPDAQKRAQLGLKILQINTCRELFIKPFAIVEAL